MAIRLADRMTGIKPSGIRKVFDLANKMASEGKEIVNLCIGRPDFDTPVHIKEAAKRALDEGHVHYTPNPGIEELRQAVADKLLADNEIKVSSNEVIVTVGANEASFLPVITFLNPGDEVMVNDPVWPHYFYCGLAVGAKVVRLPLREENGFLPDIKDVEALTTPKTRMLILNTPNNPTGACFPRPVLQEIAQWAKKNDVLVVSDEIYEKLVYDGTEHVSIASLPGMAERTLTVNGWSKAYSMTGWRLGYVAGPQDAIDGMLKIHQYTVTSATSFAQYGGLEALRGPQDCVENMRQEFDRRRQLIVEAMNSLDGVRCVEPKGAFYVFPNIQGLGMTPEEACRFFLEEAGVAMVPGPEFGEYGDGYLRAAYSESYDKIERGMERLAKALGSR